MPNDLPPLDEWIEEPVTITTVEPVMKDGKLVELKQGKREVMQRTRYTSAPEVKIDCGKGKHDWYIPDKHTHVAHCRRCKRRQFLRAVYETIKAGNIINRDTEELIV